ncbi:hypothetical protein Mapa_011698 [Marchantia paleacea]|nr:hypothetical protein Mapa_011698 [Marchantia paleacea]
MLILPFRSKPNFSNIIICRLSSRISDCLISAEQDETKASKTTAVTPASVILLTAIMAYSWLRFRLSTPPSLPDTSLPRPPLHYSHIQIPRALRGPPVRPTITRPPLASHARLLARRRPRLATSTASQKPRHLRAQMLPVKNRSTTTPATTSLLFPCPSTSCSVPSP